MRNLILLILLSLLTTKTHSQQPPNNPRQLLVVSGGGARGAWGAGVLTSLIKRNGGYQAVFGTSTGSLMAPLILLQDMELLDSAYSHVTQDSIFNKNPFSVNYDAATGTVTTGFNFRAVWRALFGFKTFGESKRLFSLIQHFLPPTRYDSLIDLYRTQKKVLAVAVTNTKTGLIKLIYDSTFTHDDYDQLCHWIWASANEPLYMSYVQMGDASYVDGGLREVIPIQQALTYAINHDIDSIDVVINNSEVPIVQNWNVNGGGILYGLERVLGIYDFGTVHYNESYARLQAKYFNALDSLSTYQPSAATATAGPKRFLRINFYCMPDSLAAKYPNELGFVQPAMIALLKAGLQYGADPTQHCFHVRIDREIMRNNPESINP